jgi:predicted RNase H-like nuclease (RuvC/YqgF family)
MKELNAEKSIIIAKLKRELEHKDETIESLKKELFHSKKDDRLDDYRID